MKPILKEGLYQATFSAMEEDNTTPINWTTAVSPVRTIVRNGDETVYEHIVPLTPELRTFLTNYGATAVNFHSAMYNNDDAYNGPIGMTIGGGEITVFTFASVAPVLFFQTEMDFKVGEVAVLTNYLQRVTKVDTVQPASSSSQGAVMLALAAGFGAARVLA